MVSAGLCTSEKTSQKTYVGLFYKVGHLLTRLKYQPFEFCSQVVWAAVRGKHNFSAALLSLLTPSSHEDIAAAQSLER